MSRSQHPSIREQAAAYREGAAGEEEIVAGVQRALAASEAGSEPLGAFINVHLEAEGIPGRGVLAGVPLAIKDNIATLGLPTTCGSRLLEEYRSPFEATAVQRLRAAGARIVGKTNLDEFAMGNSTEFSAFGPTRNPWDRGRVAGGSSGGSAAAVAAGIVPAALGSDTGGSVRQPAAFCGVVGIKPSYGRISRHGLIAHASSLDQIGVLARTVADAALVLGVIAGVDPLDPTSADLPVPELSPELPGSLRRVVIGVPHEYFSAEVDREVLALCRAALERLEAAGAELREVSLPHSAVAIPTYYVLAPAEAASNLARFDGIRFGMRASSVHSLEEVYERTRDLFGPEVKRRIVLGTLLTSGKYFEERYRRAQRVRRLIARDFEEVFASGVDALFTPTTPSPAFPLGAVAGEVDHRLRSDVFTVGANLAGLPALSLPIGRAGTLPVGGQLIGPRFQEAALLQIARRLESDLPALLGPMAATGDVNPRQQP